MQIQNAEHFAKVLAFAESIAMLDQLQACLHRLEQLAANLGGELSLGYDFAPQSFTWAIVRDGACVFNGGLIFHGQHDGGGNGDAPTFSVSLSPETGWQIHS